MKKSYNNIGSMGFALMLTVVCGSVQAQTKTVTGKVTVREVDNIMTLPLSGVSVSQLGSDQTAVTNAQGVYRLEISGDSTNRGGDGKGVVSGDGSVMGSVSHVLVFRHPEYAEQRVEVGDRTVVDVSLTTKVKVQGIEEVVVNAGYYKVKDRENTGSIAKVTAKDIGNQPVNNVLSAIQGRMTGVNITQNSGVAGGGYDIQIRGRNSLRTLQNSGSDGNQPLYVIDGVPIGSAINANFSATVIPFKSINPLNNINPNDIESIEILKDADATAIYGSRGANGVILVTTKKGRRGNPSVLLNATYGMSKVARRLEMMDRDQYLSMRRQAFANAGITSYPVNAYDVNGKWDQTRYTDWQKELIGNWADQRTIQLSVSGGGERSSFLISAQNSDQSTVFPADFGYKTNLFNSNFTFESENKKFSLTSSNSFAALANNLVQSDLTNLALNLSPVAPALFTTSGELNWEDNTFTNPLASLNGSYKNKTYQFNQNLNLGYEFFTGFSLKLNTGINYQTLEEFLLKPHTIFNPSLGRTSNDSSSSRSKNDIFTYIVEPQLNWLKSWGDHELNVLVGTSFQQTLNKTSSITGTGFASNALLENLAAATNKNIPADIRNEYRYASIFGRVNYQYKNRYIVNITGRRDGSSRFGVNNRFADFGAIGAAWLFSKENFLKDKKWLSFGKLRGSVGTTGSDFIGDYQYLDTYTISNNPYNGSAGLYPSRLYNPNFSWEKTTKLEAALELGFLRDRIFLTSAYYRNRSSNQLLGIPLPGTTGFTSIQANLDATVENRGWEFQLSASPIKSTDWKWQTSFNISFPKSELISFPGLEGSTYANTFVVGMPTNIVKLYTYEGINQATGQYVFTDYNQDGKITSPNDLQAVRELGTKYFGGWQNDLRFKNVSLSFLFQFVKQNNFNYYRNMPNPGVLLNSPAAFTNVWSADNPGGIIMPYDPGTTAVTNTLNSNFKSSTAAVSDASFIRLKNVQLNYSIPLQGSFVKEATFFVQGQNLLTITNYFGLDPEFILSGYLPPLKTYSFGVQVKF